MKTFLITSTIFWAIFCQAAPYLPEQLQLRTTINLSADLQISASSIFNPRFFDGFIYANQINAPAFGRYRSGSRRPLMTVDNTFIPLEHRMVAAFRGTNTSSYLLASSGATTFTFSRYDFDGMNRVDADVPGASQTAEGFDWVDDQTIIYTTYSPSGNRKRLALAHVVAEPFAVTADTRWNANGYITTSVTTRIRNVRVGDVYSSYAYYGDAGQNASPNFYAVNLDTGEETLLGNAGVLSGSGSYGVWTVLERDGYLYVQTTDNGIQVYSMTNATTLGSIYTTYTKGALDSVTGSSGQYWGLDVTSDGTRLVLGATGLLFELGPVPPLIWTNTVRPYADLFINPSSMYNPRLFDGDVYVSQINTPAIGRYPSGVSTPSFLVDNSWIPLEHRMIAPFRGVNATTYILGSSGALAPNTTLLSRYDFYGTSRVDADVPGGGQAAEGFDWVDDQTIIYTTYTPSANRKRLSLAHVEAEPFAVTADTRWNASGYVTTSVSTRIRNVRVGDVYRGFAYYGDAGQNINPSFYALDLATGVETPLGNAGTLTGGGSFGLWTVVERSGYLYVQTTDNGIQIYKMNSATQLGPLHAIYTKADIDLATGYTNQYFGFDITADRRHLVLAGGEGAVYELIAQGDSVDEPLALGIAQAGPNLILTWTAAVTNAVLQSAASLGSFTDMMPQPEVTVSNNLNYATIPIGTGTGFIRLRK